MADSDPSDMAPTPNPPKHEFTISPSISSRFLLPVKTYLERYSTVTYKSSSYTIAGVGSGAIVITTSLAPQPHASGTQRQPRVLLIRRAAHDSMPNRWETPGGAVDDDDPTILHGVARELFEEAGLRAVGIEGFVGEDEGGFVFMTSRGRLVSKMSFLVTVDVDEGTDGVKLDANEHSDYCWATEEECRKGQLRRKKKTWKEPEDASDGAGASRTPDEEDEHMDIQFTTQDQKAIVLLGFELWNKLHADDNGPDVNLTG